jgi:uncharacterized damage-inducible protein DinB
MAPYNRWMNERLYGCCEKSSDHVTDPLWLPEMEETRQRP